MLKRNNINFEEPQRWAHRNAGKQIAKHRSQAEAGCYRHSDNPCDQQDES